MQNALSMMLRTPMLAVALLAASSACLAQTGATGVPLMKPPLTAPKASASAPAAAAGAAKTITWEQLVPPGWDPFKDFRGMDMQSMQDGDPRANQMLKQMRQAWDNAPVNPAMVGQVVRIPGFVVPLEDGKDGLKEFLLVPYFGACVHSPPPPSNQIIHVLPKSAAKGYRSMDTVWISGVLSTVQTDSYMGNASWRIEATNVQPYVEQRRGNINDPAPAPAAR